MIPNFFVNPEVVQRKQRFTVGFFSIGFVLGKETETLAIICHTNVVILAFDSQERLVQWDIWIRNAFGCGKAIILFKEVSFTSNGAKIMMMDNNSLFKVC